MVGPAAGSQDRLFYEFNFEDIVPAHHLLRKIDAVLDLGWLRAALSPYSSHTGCPSIDPELMIRMLIVGRLSEDAGNQNLPWSIFCRTNT